MKLDSTHNLYQEVDFLPAWYVEREGRRRCGHRVTAMLAVLIVGVAVLAVQAWAARSKVQDLYHHKQELLEKTRRQVTEARKLRLSLTNLQKELRVHRLLHQPINFSQITGTLAAVTPDAIALTGLAMEVEQITITRPAPPSTAAEKKAGAKKDVIREQRPVVAIVIDGLAPSDVDIANFIGRLAESNVFENVKMVYSRQGRREALVTREFQLRMEVRLDVRYLDQAEGEIADAH